MDRMTIIGEDDKEKYVADNQNAADATGVYQQFRFKCHHTPSSRMMVILTDAAVAATD